MQSVGTRLKEARNGKGFTLAEISARTRINTRNLSAIEDDQVCDISSPFFYRSFVRQFADEVNVDYQTLSPAVEVLAGHMRQPDLPGQGDHQPLRVAPIQPRIKRDFGWVAPAALFLGAVVLCSGGYAAWKYYRPLMTAQNMSVSVLVRKEIKAVPVAEMKAAKAESLPAQAPTIDAAAAATTSPENIHLELAATERTWLSVSADGKTAYTGILEPTETKVLEGQDSAKLRTGNAGGVNITFNGKPIGAIGPRGKTRTVVFTKTGYEVQPFEGSVHALPANHIGG